MEVCTIASGSSGNCTLVQCGSTRVLIDAGISARRITTAMKDLGVEPDSLSAILVTHEHTDHICGIATLTKKLRVPIYTTAPTARQLCEKSAFLDDLIRTVEPGTGFELGSFWCESFATPHDTAGSAGFALSGDGCKMALCTDLGHVTREVWDGVAGADLLIAEANHDEDWVRSGPYPYYLKQRILGDHGHLSNEMGAALVCRAVEAGARTVLLAHLSAENNAPAHAREVVARQLRCAGVDPERDIRLVVAPRSEPGQVYSLERKERAGC